MTSRQSVLEVGCGRNRDPRATHRIDANPNVFTKQEIAAGCHAVGDATELPWSDEYFDSVLAIDVLEHLPMRSTSIALAEWCRVLKPGGTVYVQVPDAGRIMKDYADGNARLEWHRLPDDLQGYPGIYGSAWRIMGGQGDGQYTRDGDDPVLNLHQTMFDRESLEWFLSHVGLEIKSIESNNHPNLCCWAVKP